MSEMCKRGKKKNPKPFSLSILWKISPVFSWKWCFHMVAVWVHYLYLLSLMEQESKTMERAMFDPLVLLIRRADTPACHFLQLFSQLYSSLNLPSLKCLTCLFKHAIWGTWQKPVCRATWKYSTLLFVSATADLWPSAWYWLSQIWQE